MKIDADRSPNSRHSQPVRHSLGDGGIMHGSFILVGFDRAQPNGCGARLARVLL